MNWQPIETAPTDTWVLIGWMGEDGVWRHEIASHMVDELDTIKRRRYWVDSYEGYSWPATHWMPLPPPPQDKET